MNNRLFLYSALFFVLILIYDAWDQTKPINQVSNQQEALIPATENVNKKPSKDNHKEEENIPANKTLGAENFITVTTDALKLKISLKDGAIVSSELINFKQEFKDNSENVFLLDNRNTEYIARADVQSKTTQQPKTYNSDKKKYIMRGDDLSVVINAKQKGNFSIEKKYMLTKSSHLINVTQTIKNNSNSNLEWRQFNTLHRGPELGGNAMLYTYTGAVYYDDETKFNKITFEDIEESNFLYKTASSWVGMIQHYFFTAWIPGNSNLKQTIYTRKLQDKSYLIGVVTDYLLVRPGESITFNSRLYVGPKTVSEISHIAPGLDLTVDYGVLTFLAAPLFWVLDKLHYVSGNWGWSIIFLTILIKLLFFKLSETSYKSMAKMKKLAPRMNALKERYADDKQKFSEALMKIYKEEKVNPLGGCLPILIQIPVFIALYWVIIESVEMRHAPFLAWITDLSSQDPYYVLPVLMGVSMYLQQKLNPPPTDPMQQKIFLALPFIFTALFATFPSGLVLYWFVNNVLSIAQQYLINKRLAV
tara:strand:+ start:766 stop:2364 length:1599 start_codon:yes stop_codon:yes gene_type:complete